MDPSNRQLLVEIIGMLERDVRALRARFGTEEFESTRRVLRQILNAVDFNSYGKSEISHNKEWYMAANVVAALQGRDSSTRGVFLAHNAHITHPTDVADTSGALLRNVLGCGYGALTVTFGEGAFVARIPGDPQDRLAVSELPHSPEQSIEGVLSKVHPDSALFTWNCKTEVSELPEWLRQPQLMHWVGALWKPGSDPSEAFQPFSLVKDFDGVVYLRHVTAEDVFNTELGVPASLERQSHIESIVFPPIPASSALILLRDASGRLTA